MLIKPVMVSESWTWVKPTTKRRSWSPWRNKYKVEETHQYRILGSIEVIRTSFSYMALLCKLNKGRQMPPWQIEVLSSRLRVHHAVILLFSCSLLPETHGRASLPLTDLYIQEVFDRVWFDLREKVITTGLRRIKGTNNVISALHWISTIADCNSGSVEIVLKFCCTQDH